MTAALILFAVASARAHSPSSGVPITQPLDGQWIATSRSLQLRMHASVPGDLISDLQKAGLVRDPWFENNFLNGSLWNAPDWVYSTSFVVDPAIIRPGGTVLLCLESVKQGAVVSLGGVEVGRLTDQFVRYTFDVTSRVHAGGTILLEVAFDPSINTHGRFMAATGGWDWAPWSHTWDANDAPTFSRGVVGSVYLLPVRHALLTDVSVHTFYRGPHATAPLIEGQHAGFWLLVKLHVEAQVALHGVLTIRTSWSRTAATSVVSLAAGEQLITRNLSVSAAEIKLWWPLNVGAQQLYTVSLSLDVAPEACGACERERLVANRTVGFRSLSWVTGNESDPDFLSSAGDGSASPTFTTFLRVNGARILARGSNMIPLDQLEGRVSDRAYTNTVASAAAAGMNMLRVWGGGVYYPNSFYSACDRWGVMVYHDMMFAQEGHSPCCSWYGPCWYGRCDLSHAQANCSCDSAAGREQELELRQQIRRLSSHPSIVLWDAVNEAGGFGLFSSFVMRTVAEEDESRIVWPASPSQGWSSGVHSLSGLPNGKPLRNQAWCPHAPNGGRSGCEDVKEVHGNYVAAGWSDGGFAVDFGKFTPEMPAGMEFGASGSPPWKPAPVYPFHPPVLPVFYPPATWWQPQLTDLSSLAVGMRSRGYFVSEFGVSGFSSFEALAPYMAREHYGVHTEPFHRRSHNHDQMILSYFGQRAFERLDEVGELPFKAALYLSMLAQALHLRSMVESFRASNVHGLLTWDLGENWPTAGWGSLEHGSGPNIAGAVEGGRWKPALYALRAAFADVFAACGQLPAANSSSGEQAQQPLVCYIRNDCPRRARALRVSISFLRLGDGASTTVRKFDTSVQPVSELPSEGPPHAPNALHWACVAEQQPANSSSREQRVVEAAEPSSISHCAALVDVLKLAGCKQDATDCLLNVSITSADGAIKSEHLQPLVAPKDLAFRANTTLDLEVLPTGDAVIVRAKGGVALWVVLTSTAAGRFVDNGFFLRPGEVRKIGFVPLDSDLPLVERLTWSSVRVEHFAEHMPLQH